MQTLRSVDVPNVKCPKVPISAVGTGCQAHALGDAWGSVVVQDDTLLCLGTAGRGGEVRNDSWVFTGGVSSPAVLTGALWNGAWEKWSKASLCLLRTARGRFQNETLPRRAMPRSKRRWRGGFEWTPLDGNEGETSTWPDHLSWPCSTACWLRTSRSNTRRHPYTSAQTWTTFWQLYSMSDLQGFFGSFSNHAWSAWKSKLRDVLIPRACPERTRLFYFLSFFKCKHWKITAALLQSS